jgi:hypothetical protein
MKQKKQVKPLKKSKKLETTMPLRRAPWAVKE